MRPLQFPVVERTAADTAEARDTAETAVTLPL